MWRSKEGKCGSRVFFRMLRVNSKTKCHPLHNKFPLSHRRNVRMVHWENKWTSRFSKSFAPCAIRRTERQINICGRYIKVSCGFIHNDYEYGRFMHFWTFNCSDVLCVWFCTHHMNFPTRDDKVFLDFDHCLLTGSPDVPSFPGIPGSPCEQRPK